MPLLPGHPPVELTLRRSARARRINLRVSALDGRVTLTLPSRMREAEALAFAHDRADWIRDVLARIPQANVVRIGVALPVEGRPSRLVSGPKGGAVRAVAEGLMVPGDPDEAGVRVAAYLRVIARDRLATACDRYSTLLGRPYRRLTLRDTRSRWGSCTAQGGLMFSWRLVMAPPDVLNYVAAHEVAHLAQMNHSPAFWAEVGRLMPDYGVSRRWLRAHGAALHGWRFDGPAAGT